MKEYPLEVQELRELKGRHMGWWSKGHHDAHAFLGYVPIEGIEVQLHAKNVHHVWWRCVPAGWENPGCFLFREAKGSGRGAFPVTVWEG